MTTKGNVRLTRTRAKGPNGWRLVRFPQHEACLEELLLPSGRDASPSQGYPLAVCRRYHLYTWMNSEKMDSEVPCLRKQRDGRSLNPCIRGANHSATHASNEEHQANFKHKGEPNKAKGNQI